MSCYKYKWMWICDEGHVGNRHTPIEFDLNIILVMCQERLRVEVIRVLRENIKILPVPKS